MTAYWMTVRTTPRASGVRPPPLSCWAGRLEAWRRLASDLDVEKLGAIGRRVGLSEVIPLAAELIDGKVRGRVVVDVNA